MEPTVRRPAATEEYLTPEGCWIQESWNQSADPAVSIARARVAPGVTTGLHRLRGVSERYVIVSGHGVVRVGALEPAPVSLGAVVVIPPETDQQITNDGTEDLVFYCVCTPRFTPDCYVAVE